MNALRTDGHETRTDRLKEESMIDSRHNRAIDGQTSNDVATCHKYNHCELTAQRSVDASQWDFHFCSCLAQ